MTSYTVKVSLEIPVNQEALRIHRELRSLLPKQYHTYASGFLDDSGYVNSIFMNKPLDPFYLKVEWKKDGKDITVTSTELTFEQIKAVLDVKTPHPN